MASLLEVTDLAVTVHRVGRAVDAVDLEVGAGEMVGLVGESGCGKTLTAYSLLGLLPDGIGSSGALRFEDREYDLARQGSTRELRGGAIAMVSQDPLTALNPVMRIGSQIEDVMRTHLDLSRAQRKARVLELLDRVGISAPRRVAQSYPFELSGGMRQRALIAMAISCHPRLLIADEPTTALDSTVQAQIMELLATLVAEENLAMLLITHDLGLVSQYCSRVCVMYAGQIIEEGGAAAVLEEARHPYTRALVDCLTSLESGTGRLATIEGVVPAVGGVSQGCRFADRCKHVQQRCREIRPNLSLLSVDRSAACLRVDELGPGQSTMEVDR
ncbi:ABC transporter ATP-binding protein [Jatrophihabitans sp. DSM 45814]